jgi:sensor c-di-GMP phosphodiesterase-like protein
LDQAKVTDVETLLRWRTEKSTMLKPAIISAPSIGRRLTR